MGHKEAFSEVSWFSRALDGCSGESLPSVVQQHMARCTGVASDTRPVFAPGFIMGLNVVWIATTVPWLNEYTVETSNGISDPVCSLHRLQLEFGGFDKGKACWTLTKIGVFVSPSLPRLGLPQKK